MLTSDSLRSAEGSTEATTRRRLLHIAATLTATAPLAALTATGNRTGIARDPHHRSSPHPEGGPGAPIRR
jgi:hypothetical protein